jgi:LmbE family N-acetylglucosaminyl deacetylase
VPLIEINKIIEKHVKDFNPSIVFTHSSRDLNNDHAICFKSTMIALRPGGCSIVEKIYSYEVPSSSDWNYLDPFRPNCFLPLEREHVAKKWDALAYYKTEISAFPHPRSKIGIENLAKQRGMQCGQQFAEAYEMIIGIM